MPFRAIQSRRSEPRKGSRKEKDTSCFFAWMNLDPEFSFAFTIPTCLTGHHLRGIVRQLSN